MPQNAQKSFLALQLLVPGGVVEIGSQVAPFGPLVKISEPRSTVEDLEFIQMMGLHDYASTSTVQMMNFEEKNSALEKDK